ncbi:DapH/DapD/GlmU-related protein [Kineosporia mesophila]|uniref:DapH/DapD/GlmU-related protein n=1 Tax=Kineosporia mesophila TaxID=566012 RepID=A0ABP6Z2Q4_9ACTN|nr:putative colanic acid biosynthesis acetyltransferase [Kineosporia mesophila]MCD5351156.1 putative colanic acid biosynthesis acetyltransferase [Kineosporia mesophila]
MNETDPVQQLPQIQTIRSVPSPGHRRVPALDVLLTPHDRALRPGRDLSAFTGAGYDKGRSKLWQAAWFATMNLVFSKWWLPARFRPPILRAFGATVGERVLIRHRVRVLWPWKLTIGDDCWIGEGSWLLNLEPITLADDVCISQEAMLCTGSHRHGDPAFEFDNAAIQVGRGAWVAARATVLRGASVEPGEVVPAHAVRGRRS